jgi:hypothetical protein
VLGVAMSKAMGVQNGAHPDQTDRVEVEECVPASRCVHYQLCLLHARDGRSACGQLRCNGAFVRCLCCVQRSCAAACGVMAHFIVTVASCWRVADV